MNTKNLVYKRIFDLFISSLFSIALLPLFLLIIILYCIESVLRFDYSPMFLTENRISRGKEFKMFKMNIYQNEFRKQYEKTSDTFKRYSTYAGLQQNNQSLSFTGLVLKKFYIDEIPQIFNVLKGDMSLVGPRPQPVGHPDNQGKCRQLLKTGMVGFVANKWKTGGHTFVKHSTDLQYLELVTHAKPLQLMKIDFLALLDGIRASIRGKGL